MRDQKPKPGEPFEFPSSPEEFQAYMGELWSLPGRYVAEIINGGSNLLVRINIGSQSIVNASGLIESSDAINEHMAQTTAEDMAHEIHRSARAHYKSIFDKDPFTADLAKFRCKVLEYIADKYAPKLEDVYAAMEMATEEVLEDKKKQKGRVW